MTRPIAFAVAALLVAGMSGSALARSVKAEVVDVDPEKRTIQVRHHDTGVMHTYTLPASARISFGGEASELTRKMRGHTVTLHLKEQVSALESVDH